MPLSYSIIPCFYFVILFEYSFSLLLNYPNILLPYSSSDFLKAQAHPPKIQIQTCTSERICDYKPRRGVSWPRLLFLANVCVAFCSAVMNDIMIEENKVNKKSDDE